MRAGIITDTSMPVIRGGLTSNFHTRPSRMPATVPGL